MSIRQSSLVWQHSRATHGTRLVALAIADFCDDDGRAYPAVKTLARKCALSYRATQSAIRELESIGELTIEKNTGPHGVNRYCLNVTPAESAPRQNLHPGRICTPPRQKTTFTPAESAPKPSLTVIEPSIPPTAPEKEQRNGFAVFWAAYPKKRSKGDAERAWKTMKCEPETESIVAAIDRAKESHDWTKDGGQFIPYPASWIRSKGWEDEAFIAPQPVIHFAPYVPRINGSPTLRDQLQANLDHLAEHGRLPTAEETDQVHTDWMAAHPNAEGWEQ